MSIGIRLGLALALVGCSCARPPGPTPIVVPEGACKAAQERLEGLQCVSEGVELWDGFAEMCSLDAADGIDDHPLCIIAAPSCEVAMAGWMDGCGP